VYSRILLPLDGSSDWESLVPHLQAFSRGAESEILDLEAVPFTETLFEMPLAFSPSHFGIGSDTEVAEKYAASVAELLRDAGLRARELVQIGSPSDTIAGVARRQKSTLIALAIRQRQGFAHRLFRTLAESIVRASPTPVYAIPAGLEAIASTPDILIPADDRGLFLGAIPAAAEFGRRGSGRLVFLHVETSESDRESVRHWMGAALRGAEKEGVPAEAILTAGDPAEEILKLCAALRPSLIAMGPRLSLSETGPVGSVTFRVLRAARAPMLIVRRPMRLLARPA
jgi:nucleotide-binding universal stress UspA family protein